MKFIKWFEEVGTGDVALVGGKNASLGEMIRNLSEKGVAVPSGFAITTDAYKYFIEYNGIDNKIKKILRGITVSDAKKLKKQSDKIRRLIESGEFPPDLEEQIINKYAVLGERAGVENPLVKIRSFAIAGDHLEANFAGPEETSSDVKGVSELLTMVKKTFTSLFTSKAISYREEKGTPPDMVYLGCAVQVMANSKFTDMTFTSAKGNKDVEVIESGYIKIGIGIFKFENRHYRSLKNIEGLEGAYLMACRKKIKG